MIESQNRRIGGYATIYGRQTSDSAARGMAFYFQRGAFEKFIASNPDVALQSWHDPTRIVARTANGTLRLWSDSIGVGFAATLANTTQGNDLLEEVRSGLLGEVSIGVRTGSDVAKGDWKNMHGVATFVMTQGEFAELSILREGAMPGTSVRALRRLEATKDSQFAGAK